MDPLLTAIREKPLAYLPEVSLRAFGHFRGAYGIRCVMEGRPHNWQYDGRAFWDWLADRFELKGGAALNDISIVSSFSGNDEEGFYGYFELLEKFLQRSQTEGKVIDSKSERRDFVAMLKAIRERPPMYLGHASFRALHAYLVGDERAYRDLELTGDEDRSVFDGFKKWVEAEKNQAAARPWFKVIEFWSGGVDCGHSPKSGAFSIFYSWLDQYAQTIGRAELFHLKIAQ